MWAVQVRVIIGLTWLCVYLLQTLLLQSSYIDGEKGDESSTEAEKDSFHGPPRCNKDRDEVDGLISCDIDITDVEVRVWSIC